MKTKYIFLFVLCTFPAMLFSQTWVQQFSGTSQILESVFMINESEGWIVGDAGTLLRTVNGGNTWTQVSVTNQDLQDISFRDPQTGIIAGDDGLIMRTTNGGLNWTSIPSGIGANLASVTWATNDMVFISGRDGAALVSLNAGVSWTILNTGTTARYRGGYAVNNNFWAVGEDGIIRYSSNAGASWQSQASPATDDLHDVQFLNETTGFAGGDELIYTANGGTTWQNRSGGINFEINGIYFIDVNTGWAATDGGTIYTTVNGGLTWTAQATGTSTIINEVHFPTVNKGWAVGENGQIFFFDSGVPVELNSFTADVNGSTVNLSWSTATETNNRGFEIQRKNDIDNTWITAGFKNGRGNSTELNTYTFTDNELSAGTYNYRLRQIDYDGTFDIFDLSGEIEITPVNEYSLSQNYPNPFNPSTTINYSIASAGPVTIKLYNTIGKEVATLVNSNKEAGRYSVDFSGTGLSSGIYLYKIETAEFTQVRKMTLLK
jgi:photosystem II stability/assembly factor-like uncharacterized protein